MGDEGRNPFTPVTTHSSWVPSWDAQRWPASPDLPGAQCSGLDCHPQLPGKAALAALARSTPTPGPPSTTSLS